MFTVTSEASVWM